MQRERPVNFPGTDRPLGVLVPLLCEDLQNATAAAQARFREAGLELSLYTSDDYWTEINLQCIWRALRDPELKTARLFGAADEMRQTLTPDERTMLTTEYLELQAESNPKPESIDVKTFAEIDAAIKKKDVIRLSAFGSSTLAVYLLSMVAQRSNSDTGSSASLP